MTLIDLEGQHLLHAFLDAFLQVVQLSVTYGVSDLLIDASLIKFTYLMQHFISFSFNKNLSYRRGTCEALC